MRQPVPFGKYLLLDRISVGGMAEVFKAKSYGVEGFEKIIAIKRILPTMGEDRDFIKMFIDEAKIAGQLAHANICQIFELGRIDGSHFIAMEYIWGKDLLQIQNRLRKVKQQMPVPMACFAIAKVLEGLDYAHRKRDPLGRPLEIVHRDCSPQNVLVSYEGEVKVIDFGIAKATSRNSRTMAGVLKGKFGYMSPEQVRGLPLDRRSDIFALGTMLYECLTGERLFQGETDFSTLEKVRNVDIQNPRAINPAIPEAIERVILKALAKDVDDRYQWCSEMLSDLQQYLMSQDVVFTAKSLSGWLKEVFSGEIEKERQLLEQYKRVGRDGLIAGVPAAAANKDVVQNLGEAPEPEGDSTQLGGPSFDILEQAVAAGSAPQVGPAPGSPAARGAAAPDDDDEDDEEFGEEAPTEIFGELDAPAHAAPPAPVAKQPSVPMAAAGANKPPKPPPGRATQGHAAQMGASPSGPMSSPQRPTTIPPPIPNTPQEFAGAAASPAAGVPSYGNNAPYAPGGYVPEYRPPGAPTSSPMAVPNATPNSVPSQPMNAIAPPGGNQSKTLMGAVAPIGNYGPNYRVTGQQPAYTGGTPQGYPTQPSQPNMHGYPQQNPSTPGMQGYNPAAYNNAVGPVEHTVPVGAKKSSIGRDVAIGVAIAALVLGGFLAVKFFILDAGGGSGGGSKDTSTSSTIATIRLSIPTGVSAELFVDDKRIAKVSDKQEIPVSAGSRKVKLVGPNGTKCEQKLDLPGGKTTPLECPLKAGAPEVPSTGSGSGSATGSGAGSGSAGAAVVPATGSGSATTTEVKTTTKSTDTTKPADTTKTTDTLKTTDKTVTKPADTTKTTDKTTDKTTKTTDKTTKVRTTDKPPVEEKSDKGYLTVTSKPAAKILVDGVDTGLTTPISGKALSLTPGKHKVTFVIGGDKFTFAVMIKAGATESLNKDLQ